MPRFLEDDDDDGSIWRKLLISGGALFGAAAAYNFYARQRCGQIAEPHRRRGRGLELARATYRFHATRQRARATTHPRHPRCRVVVRVAQQRRLPRPSHTVYTLDLLGFGRSDRPAIKYGARLYIALISDFVAQVIGGPCILVASSLSAAYAMILGARDPHRFPALALIQPTGLTRLNEDAGFGGDAGRLAIDSPVVGTAAFNALVSRRSLRHYLEMAYADDTLVTDELVDVQYDTSHQPGARHAPAAFIAGHLNIDVRRALRRLRQPALLFWGEQAQLSPVEEIRGFRTLKQDFDVHILSPAGDLPHDERPDEFNVILSTWLNRRLHSSERTPDTLPGTPEASPLTPPAS